MKTGKKYRKKAWTHCRRCGLPWPEKEQTKDGVCPACKPKGNKPMSKYEKLENNGYFIKHKNKKRSKHVS